MIDCDITKFTILRSFQSVPMVLSSLMVFQEDVLIQKKITLNIIYNGYDIITLDGLNMMYFTNTLREIYMDGSFSSSITVGCVLSDFNYFPNIFLFHKCCNVLERSSIRNVKYYRGRSIPQNALIKFVRNGPSTLKWLRSDLSTENIDMLRKERPGIELVN